MFNYGCRILLKHNEAYDFLNLQIILISPIYVSETPFVEN